MVKLLLASGKGKAHRYRRCLLKAESLELLCPDRMWGAPRWLDDIGVESGYCGFWFTVRQKHSRDGRGENNRRWNLQVSADTCPFPSSFRREWNRMCLFLRFSLVTWAHRANLYRQMSQSSQEPSALETSICAETWDGSTWKPPWMAGQPVSPSPSREVLLGAGASLVCAVEGHTGY